MSRAGAAGWLGAVARVLAFVGLLVVFSIVFDALRSVAGLAHRAQLLMSVTVTALAATTAGIVLLRGVEQRSWEALGIGFSRETGRHWLLGLGIGAAALVVAVLALLATGALRYAGETGGALSWIGVVAAQLGFFAIAAYAEEALFRGYAFQVLARSGGVIVAAVVTSGLFALAHARNPSVGVFALINIFLAGLLLAAAYVRTLSLWFATAVHLGWNWAMASLFDLPVSGLTGFDTPLYEPTVGGPGWWSGGAFGPEGGLVGSVGFAVALVLVLRWRWIRPDPRIAAARPLFLKEEESHAG